MKRVNATALVALAGGLLTLAGPGLALAMENPPSVAGGAESAAATAAPASSAIEAVVFYALAALAAGSALGCVIATNIVRMAMCLLGTLGAVALLYFLMAANFLGAVQLVVYAGGTLIVIVFGVMLTSRAYGTRLRPRRGEVLGAAVVSMGLLIGLTTVLATANWAAIGLAPPADAPAEGARVASIGQALLTTYLVPFELASVLLLAVMIGAAYLAEPQRK